MANAFTTQALVEKAVQFAWHENEGVARHIKFRNDLISAQKNTGATVTLRRPSRLHGTQRGLESSGANDLPSNTQPSVGYKPLIDAPVPLTLTVAVEANMQASMEELTYKLDRTDAYERFIKPAIVDAKDQMNLAIMQASLYQAGQVITGDSTTWSNYAQRYTNALLQAESLLLQRGACSESEDRIALVPPSVMPKVGPAAQQMFHFANAERIASGDPAGLSGMNAIKAFRSPLIPRFTAPTDPGTIKTVAPTTGVPNGVASGFALTWLLGVTGLAASTTYKAGTYFAINENWLMPTVQQDTGIQTTYMLVEDVTSDGSGNATLKLSEARIFGGDFKNVTGSTALAANVSVSIVQAPSGSTIQPTVVFARDAIVGVSPKVDIPKGVVYGKNFTFDNGLNFALIEDRWPGTLQNIVKLIGFIGVSVVKSEGVVALNV